jgi:sugar phosphate isomerase/epimerase
MNLKALPFRLGTTSYIIPDDILPNVRYLAGWLRDVELVLFEVDDGPSNLPSAEVVAELAHLAAEHDLSYTVHLPLDLRLGEDGDAQHVSLRKAQRVIEATRALNPWAYVVHLDGRAVRESGPGPARARWQDQSLRALEMAAGWAGDPALLAVENLEGYPLDFLDPIFARAAVSRCVDVGHLWRDGYDALSYLDERLDRARVVHLHGVAGRDHQSLHHTPLAQRDAVLRRLQASFRGVATLEIFNQPDLLDSLAAVAETLG